MICRNRDGRWDMSRCGWSSRRPVRKRTITYILWLRACDRLRPIIKRLKSCPHLSFIISFRVRYDDFIIGNFRAIIRQHTHIIIRWALRCSWSGRQVLFGAGRCFLYGFRNTRHWSKCRVIAHICRIPRYVVTGRDNLRVINSLYHGSLIETRTRPVKHYCDFNAKFAKFRRIVR